MENTMNNIQTLVRELITLKQKLEPLENAFEAAKESIRAAGAETYEIPGQGKVLVSAPVEKKPKGVELILDAEKLESADPKLKAQLISMGILKLETIYTRPSKSKVEVRLAA